MMNTLRNIQDNFQDYLLLSTDCIHDAIISTQKVSAETRLAIYSEAYQYRLIDALATTYSVLYLYLGVEEFETLARDYIKSYPSTYRSIRWFGDKFSVFLRENSDYQAYDYVAELATIEWGMALVFDAQNCSVVTLEVMQHVPIDSWPGMRFKPHPSVHCLTLLWNAMQIWQAISFEGELPEPQLSDSQTHWIVWRKALETQFCSLDEDEAWAMRSLCRGDTFGALCEGLCQWHDMQNAPLRAASLLKRWVLEGLIEAVLWKDPL